MLQELESLVRRISLFVQGLFGSFCLIRGVQLREIHVRVLLFQLLNLTVELCLVKFRHLSSGRTLARVKLMIFNQRLRTISELLQFFVLG